MHHVGSVFAPKIRVLVVDDQTVVRKLISDMLRKRGIEVVAEAEDGQEAIELALRMRPDVIVMDVSMPRLGGVEATRYIVAHLPGTAIIGHSTHEYADMAGAMIEAGASEYLLKVKESDLLVDTIFRLAESLSRFAAEAREA